MTSYRDECIAKYGELYTRFYHNEENWFTCFYCGCHATCFDHQPPITRVSDYRSLNLAHEKYIKVPSCENCNLLASDELTESLWERLDHIRAKLEKRHKRLLRGDFWEDEEMKPLGKNLRTHIKVKNAQLAALIARLEYNDGIQAYADSIDEDAIATRCF
jgi:hypothetical protein